MIEGGRCSYEGSFSFVEVWDDELVTDEEDVDGVDEEGEDDKVVEEDVIVFGSRGISSCCCSMRRIMLLVHTAAMSFCSSDSSLSLFYRMFNEFNEIHSVVLHFYLQEY